MVDTGAYGRQRSALDNIAFELGGAPWRTALSLAFGFFFTVAAIYQLGRWPAFLVFGALAFGLAMLLNALCLWRLGGRLWVNAECNQVTLEDGGCFRRRKTPWRLEEVGAVQLRAVQAWKYDQVGERTSTCINWEVVVTVAGRVLPVTIPQSRARSLRVAALLNLALGRREGKGLNGELIKMPDHVANGYERAPWSGKKAPKRGRLIRQLQGVQAFEFEKN